MTLPIRLRYINLYHALLSESFNSNTPAPTDFMGRLSSRGLRPSCISPNDRPKSFRTGTGHDRNTSKESPSQWSSARGHFLPCVMNIVYRKFPISCAKRNRNGSLDAELSQVMVDVFVHQNRPLLRFERTKERMWMLRAPNCAGRRKAIDRLHQLGAFALEVALCGVRHKQFWRGG